MNPSDDELRALRLRPAEVGALVAARRLALYGEAARTIAIADAPAAAPSGPALVIRAGEPHELDAWPTPGSWRRHDRVIVAVPDDDATRDRYLGWLRSLAGAALPDPVALAPVGAAEAGLHRLWCLTVARLVLPAAVRIEVRHDLVGIRLAQIGLGMGADVLAGPLAPDRSLPLAGVTRPTEHSRAGLHTLVRQAGLLPVDAITPGPVDAPSPRTSAPAPVNQ